MGGSCASLREMSSESRSEALFFDSTALSRPLCVDFDGTLKYLAFRHDLVAALRQSKQLGRKLIAVTATGESDGVRRGIESLELFDTIHACPKSKARLDLLVGTYGMRGFDILGDSDTDPALFECANQGALVLASPSANALALRAGNVTVLSRRASFARALLKQLRPHQWAKNALLLLPILLAPVLPDRQDAMRGLFAFLTFSFCASAGYVFNDLLDIEADRMHATKYRRPFASGALPIAAGRPLLLALVGLSFGCSWLFLPQAFTIMLGLYFIGTLSYSLYLKRLLMLDVLVLAGLYTHRILSGGIATGVKVSTWLLGFSMFLFTSLAFAKRYVELRALSGDDKVKNRGYFRTDLEIVASMGTASGFIAGLVFMLYVDSAKVRVNYREPAILWLILPILLYWLGRIWLLAGRGLMRDDPVKFALRDRISLGCAIAVAVVAAMGRFAPGWIAAGIH